MCSTMAAQLAQICLAIEELAGQAGSDDETSANSRDREAAAGTPVGGAKPGRRDGVAEAQDEAASSGQRDSTAGQRDGEATSPRPGSAAQTGGGHPATAGDLAARLAAIWAMVADADPELAKRLPGYLDVADSS